jgi:hypothetical protein
MFTNQDIVAIFFKLANFAALIGLSVYLFKKQIKPDITALIDQQEANQESLLLEQNDLEKQQLSLDQLLKEETILCEQFRIKIDTWKTTVTQSDEQQEKKQIETIDKLNKQIAHRNVYTQQTNIQDSVIDAITVSMQKSLTDHFKNEQHVAEYFNSILTFMDEKSE